MGAYISQESCAANYNFPINCNISIDGKYSTYGDVNRNNGNLFEGDPDIAGIGVLGAFFFVTGIAVLLGLLSASWWCSKNVFHLKTRESNSEARALRKRNASYSHILETLIITCSDQQIFTGGAYAIALRYAKACSVSAYHYNVVSNILLVTCATHLMSIVTSRNYWEHKWVAALRITVTSMVYIITGILLSNRGSPDRGFPTKIPDYDKDLVQGSPMFLPAACFQSGRSEASTVVNETFKANLKSFFTGQIHGWSQFLVMFIFYGVAVLISFGRLVRRGMDHNGKRKKFVEWFKKTFKILFEIRRFFYIIFAVYIFAGIAVSCWTIVIAALHIFKLRSWVHESGWNLLRISLKRLIPPHSASSFRFLMISLTLFSFLQAITDRMSLQRKFTRRRNKNIEKHNSSPGGTTLIETYANGAPSQGSNGGGKPGFESNVIGVAVTDSSNSLNSPQPIDIEAADQTRSSSRERQRSGTVQSFHRPSPSQTFPMSHARQGSRAYTSLPVRSSTSPLVPQSHGGHGYQSPEQVYQSPAPLYQSPDPNYQPSPAPQYHRNPTPPIYQSPIFISGSASNTTPPTSESRAAQVRQGDFQIPAFDFGQNEFSSSTQSIPIDISQAQQQIQMEQMQPQQQTVQAEQTAQYQEGIQEEPLEYTSTEEASYSQTRAPEPEPQQVYHTTAPVNNGARSYSRSDTQVQEVYRNSPLGISNTQQSQDQPYQLQQGQVEPRPQPQPLQRAQDHRSFSLGTSQAQRPQSGAQYQYQQGSYRSFPLTGGTSSSQVQLPHQQQQQQPQTAPQQVQAQQGQSYTATSQPPVGSASQYHSHKRAQSSVQHASTMPVVGKKSSLRGLRDQRQQHPLQQHPHQPQQTPQQEQQQLQAESGFSLGPRDAYRTF